MSRAAVFLLVNTGITGVLGFAYWTLAARLYSQSAVGRAGAVISAATLLAGVGQMNMGGMLMRFLAEAGPRSRQLVAASYAVGCVASLMLGALAVLVLNLAASPHSALRLTAVDAVVFVLAVAATVAFNLQDSVLIGIRKAVWVPVENGAFCAAKLVMLATLAGVGSWGAIFVSWMVPAVATIPLVTWLLFGWLLPPGRRGSSAAVSSDTKRRIVRFVAGDAVAALFLETSTYILPVLVALELGARQNGLFYVALLFTSTLDQVALNNSLPFIAEAAHRPDEVRRLTVRTARQIFLVLTPATLFLVFAGGLILRIYGAAYASGGHALALLALACLPRGVLALYYAKCRVEQRTYMSALVQSICCVGLIAGTIVFGRFGLVPVAAVVFGVNLACAISVLPNLRSTQARGSR